MKDKKDRKKIPVIEGSGNVFADLALPNAANLQLKAELVRQIANRIRLLGLSQAEAGTRLGLKQPDVSKLVNGRHTGFSADRLLALLNCLAVDVEIVLRPQQETKTHPATIRVREAVA
jgi:predicted XRE-type DNA-binding protein